MINDELKQELSHRKWYHQRFDGSPMYLSMVGGLGECKPEERKPAGTECYWRICFYENGKADWYLDMEDILRGAKIITDLAKTNPNVSAELMAKWEADEQAFEDYFVNFQPEKLAQMTDSELTDEFYKYAGLAGTRFTSSSIIDHFALGSDQAISDMLRQQAGSLGSESDFSKIFSVATAPIHQSFINEAEIAVLEVAIKVQKGKDIDSPEIQADLKNLEKKYFWTKNNYVDANFVDAQEFAKDVSAWLATGKELQGELAKIKSTPTKNKIAKDELFGKYRFSPLLKTLLKISEDFTRWQDERKRATYLSIYLGHSILSQMARRKNIDPNLTKYLLPNDEVEDWFSNNKISETELKSRQQKSVVIWKYDAQYVFTADEAQEVYQIMLGKIENEVASDVRGLVAMTGKAVGIARILGSASEVDKVKPGDILVAVMTRPDYVSAMKRAGAIVTDEGGITSHAAIVSRELGIPCIIGTKISTKIFKDGDKIEVNANHNWVRKMK